MTKDEMVRVSIEYLYQLICDYYKDTRERSLALTKLEECKMWLERANMK